ncbi:single-stranded DNA-binding protein [Klebsiella oxytoca]|uniref:Single-stranded DNA-binding protein n=1 Tax=Klebsiella oxytoca TaxID=571 RepID=A0AAP2BJL8_KLEOX|nr:single-stranded DNA-binding protein [Klebsiella oxytoca]MBQ0600813.1 single-stranded DNA-binding protein [Klebsiella oxytoca]
MFSKATLIGVVGVEPKYKAAVDGKDSLIAFRLGCEVFTNSKKITEWYTIKAFGRVADYLHQTIKKDSSVFLEASIRNKRWIVNGVERQGIEFHAFTARVMSDADAINHPQTDTLSSPAPVASENLLFPEMDKTENHAVEQPKQPPKPLTAEEARQVASRFRQTFEAHKQRIADLATKAPVKEEVMKHEQVSSTPTPTSADGRNPAINSCVSIPTTEISSGSSVTDNLLKAKSTLSRNSGRALNNSNGYAHVRGGWSNVQ